MNKTTSGVLYVVATPIGNRKDITLRAIEILQTVDFIAAEDTRHSLPLLQHLSINKPLLPLHEHNERDQTELIIQRIQQGASIALISDAGTPSISDPGYYLVHAARNQSIQVVPIPGACAAIAALSAAGLPTDHFVFEGFLPATPSSRLKKLQLLLKEPRTLIFYEAPHRIRDLLAAMEQIFGAEREVAIARELTKMFETIHSASLHEMREWVAQDSNQERGEIVVIVAGHKESEHSSIDTASIDIDHILTLLLQELPLKKAVTLTAKITGKRKNELYQRALLLTAQNNEK